MEDAVDALDPNSTADDYISMLRGDRKILKKLLFISNYNRQIEDGKKPSVAFSEALSKVYKIKATRLKKPGTLVRGKPAPKEMTRLFYRNILKGPVENYHAKMMGRVRTGDRRVRAEKNKEAIIEAVTQNLEKMPFPVALKHAVVEVDEEYAGASRGVQDDIKAVYKGLMDELNADESKRLYFISHYFSYRRRGEKHKDAVRSAVETVEGRRRTTPEKLQAYTEELEGRGFIPPALQPEVKKKKKKRKSKETEEALSASAPAASKRAAVFIDEGGKGKFLSGWKRLGIPLLPEVHLDEMVIGENASRDTLKSLAIGGEDELLVLGHAEDERMQLFVLRPKYAGKKSGKTRNTRLDGGESYIVVATDGSTPLSYAKTLLAEDWTRQRSVKVRGTVGYISLKGKKVTTMPPAWRSKK